jgi:hypothetical protein
MSEASAHAGPRKRHRQERKQGYVWTLRDRKAIRFQWFNEPHQALEAAGLDPDRAGRD